MKFKIKDFIENKQFEIEQIEGNIHKIKDSKSILEFILEDGKIKGLHKASLTSFYNDIYKNSEEKYFETLIDKEPNFDGYFEKYCYKIGNKIFFEVSEPSYIFKKICEFGEDDGMEGFHTLKIGYVKERDIESIVYSALFFINKDIESPPVKIQTKSSLYKYDRYIEKSIEQLKSDYKIPKLKKIKNKEALAFFNEAVTLGTHDVAFLYYYKVIEYFFYIKKEEEINKILEKYNNSSEANKNIELINEISKIKTNREKSLLENVLSSTDLEGDMINIRDEAKNLGLLKNTDTKHFVNQIYNFRNQIAHGKKSDGYDLRLPSLLNYSELENWLKVISKISRLILEKWCLEYN